MAEDIARMLGPKALESLDYVENVWTTEPWILGGHSCMPLPGTYRIFGDSLADPCGRIYWASTETADKTSVMWTAHFALVNAPPTKW